MIILADENIPFAQEAFGTIGTIRMCAGHRMTPEIVRTADVLLVRSITRVDRNLLDGSNIRFVGSATIGTDHVDESYLAGQGIAFALAPGSNAESVVEYVLAGLISLAEREKSPLRGKTIGIVGCGNIGSMLAKRLPELGLRVLHNDPPLAEIAEMEGRPHPYVSLEEVLSESDIVTIHVPLTREGPHATYHLFDEQVLYRMKPSVWLVNTSRGAVVSNPVLKKSIQDGNIAVAVLDVWEGEPSPDPELVRLVHLGTPHIAGYSYDGKVQGTIMLYQALTAFLGVPGGWDPEEVLAAGPHDRLVLERPEAGLPEGALLRFLVKQMYDIETDDRTMRTMLDRPEDVHGAFFIQLRRTYPRRRAFTRHRVSLDAPYSIWMAVNRGLCIKIP